ncbi:MAG TPA: ArsB/NhaD family transporter [Actinopolymorphaceae bacterium]|nr:ArsB/NhaD family transporter [Actinopolymorphaceae bacterium]
MITSIAVAVFVAAYLFIATERIPRIAAALGGAAVVLALGVVGADDVFYSKSTGLDWNVLFLLLGMMIMVGIVKQTGIFEYLAIWAAKRAKGDPFRVLALLCILTCLASTLLPNVAIMLVVAPVTLLVCQRLDVRPEPYLIAEVLAANLGGTATLVGDPPNLIIGFRAGLSFNDFLVNLAPFVLVLLVVFIAMCRVLFRRHFDVDPDRVAEVMALSEREAITDVGLLVRSGVVFALVLAGFLLQTVIQVEPSITAMLGAGLLILVSRLGPDSYLDEVEWETLLFFAGLFVMVGALVKVGVIDTIAGWVGSATGGSPAWAMTILLFGSAFLSAIVDNIPFVATMSPVVEHLVAPGGPLAGQTGLWWALALGADLGGNATIVGASANIVAVGIAKRNGYPIHFWQFAKYGSIVAAVTVVLALPYLLLRYA